MSYRDDIQNLLRRDFEGQFNGGTEEVYLDVLGP